MLTGHDYTQLLSDQLGFTFAPNACRIDKAIAFLAAEHDRVHGISGSSGFGRDNGALRTGQLIQQSRLSDVRPADDGHLHFRCFRSTAVGFQWRWKIARQCVEKRVYAQTVLRGYRKYLCANLVKLTGEILLS